MSGFLKSDWSLPYCLQRVQDAFNETSYGDLIDPNRRPRGERTYLELVYLYSTANKKKFTVWEPKRGNKTQVVKTHTQHYDRFHAFGVPHTRNVVLMFTTKEQTSRHLLGFSKLLRPGGHVIAVMPRQEGQIVQSPLITVNDPLLPIESKMENEVSVAPPPTVLQASYNYFDFVSKSVYIISATPVDNTCSGSMCDGQTGCEACACVSAPPMRHWSLNIAFGCTEFESVDKDDVSITSNRSLICFVHDTIRKWPLSNALLDPVDMDDSVSKNLAEWFIRLHMFTLVT